MRPSLVFFCEFCRRKVKGWHSLGGAACTYGELGRRWECTKCYSVFPIDDGGLKQAMECCRTPRTEKAAATNRIEFAKVDGGTR